MMENQFIKPINVEDSRVNNINSVLPFAVLNGVAKNTYQIYASQAPTNINTLTFSCQIPSLETAIDRIFKLREL